MNENEIMQNGTEQDVTETMPAPVGMTYEIAEGASEKPVFCSLDVTSPEGKKKLYNITNRPDYNISEFINKEIRMTGVYVDVNPRFNNDADSPNYGTYEDKPRTIIIDENGKSYIAGVSIGIFQSIREIIRIFGNPAEWAEPITVVPVNVKTPRGNMMALEIV